MADAFPLPLKRPIAFFDIEATGFDPNHDKIVEICFIKVHPDGREEVFTSRVNPGIPIPPETTAIHGISDEDVKNAPYFGAIAVKIMEFLEDTDLGGFHVSRFDIPVLARELQTSGHSFSAVGRCVVDSLKIFHKKEERNLSAAYKFYCGKELINAHSAEADTRATLEVFVAQMRRYQDLSQDINKLHDYCNQLDPRFVDSTGKFFWKHNQAYFNFGKFRSRSLKDVANENTDYLVWITEESNMPDDMVEICRKALRGVFPARQEPV